MATRKTAALDSGLIARKGQAAPAQVPMTAPATKDTIALTVRLAPELYLRLKKLGVSFRPRRTNQEMIVAAIKAYLAQAEGQEDPPARPGEP
jgi:hypothetical protein